jgi:hypothetical protein
MERLAGHPWLVERVLPLLTAGGRLQELGWQILDALGARSRAGLQGRDLEAIAEPVQAFINIRCLVDVCTAACSHVASIAEVSFALIKDNCWSQWVQGGSGRARTVSNKLKQTRRMVAMEGLAAASSVMQKVMEGVQQGAEVEKVVMVAAKQLQVVADHMWDRSVTSSKVEAALKQLHVQAAKVATTVQQK